jgi:hypothetical protein
LYQAVLVLTLVCLLQAEAQLDALKLGTLDGLQAEVAVLRQDARDKSAAMHEAEHWAAAREAALLNQVGGWL